MTDAREEILGRIRAALRDVEPDNAPIVAPAGASAPDPLGLVEHFAERVADYRATVAHCRVDEVGSAVADAVSRYLPDGGTVVVPEGLSFDVVGAVEDRGLSPAELDRIDLVVTEAAVAVAETGTVVLDHGPGQGRRVVTLVPDRHVCVVRSDQVVPDVADALARVDPLRALTWISGPSATSDIELDRVEGVHGPRTLHVVLVHVPTGGTEP